MTTGGGALEAGCVSQAVKFEFQIRKAARWLVNAGDQSDQVKSDWTFGKRTQSNVHFENSIKERKIIILIEFSPDKYENETRFGH